MIVMFIKNIAAQVILSFDDPSKKYNGDFTSTKFERLRDATSYLRLIESMEVELPTFKFNTNKLINDRNVFIHPPKNCLLQIAGSCIKFIDDNSLHEYLEYEYRVLMGFTRMFENNQSRNLGNYKMHKTGYGSFQTPHNKVHEETYRRNINYG
jgi:hypothetical protein